MYSETFIKQYLGKYFRITSPYFATLGIVRIMEYKSYLNPLFIAYSIDRDTSISIPVYDLNKALEDGSLKKLDNLDRLLYL
jgi:hypothetical protein